MSDYAVGDVLYRVSIGPLHHPVTLPAGVDRPSLGPLHHPVTLPAGVDRPSLGLDCDIVLEARTVVRVTGKSIWLDRPFRANLISRGRIRVSHVNSFACRSAGEAVAKLRARSERHVRDAENRIAHEAGILAWCATQEAG